MKRFHGQRTRKLTVSVALKRSDCESLPDDERIKQLVNLYTEQGFECLNCKLLELFLQMQQGSLISQFHNGQKSQFLRPETMLYAI